MLIVTMVTVPSGQWIDETVSQVLITSATNCPAQETVVAMKFLLHFLLSRHTQAEKPISDCLKSFLCILLVLTAEKKKLNRFLRKKLQTQKAIGKILRYTLNSICLFN